jgi:kynurenine formamidase
LDNRLWSILKNSQVYDLGHPLEPTIPVSPNHPGFRMALLRRHGDVVRADGGSAANEMFITGGHVGTHMDALAHVSHNGKLYGGLDAYEMQRGGRFQKLGIDTVPPVICRGILLDVAGSQGVHMLAPATGITADNLRGAAQAEGVEPQPGDAILVRSGWANHWKTPDVYLGHASGVPGIGESGADLIVSWGACVTGHDSIAYEQIPAGKGHALLPVHRILLVENGIHIVENLNLEQLARDRVYEFLFIVAPLQIAGATGSPVRPVAVVAQ